MTPSARQRCSQASWRRRVDEASPHGVNSYTGHGAVALKGGNPYQSYEACDPGSGPSGRLVPSKEQAKD
jgi:hypothetical protein